MVREKDRARSRELLRFLLYGAAIVVPLLGYVWQRVDFLRVSYKLEKLETQRRQLSELARQLALERATLLDTARIERKARKELGLVDPPAADVRRVTTSGGRVRTLDGPIEAGMVSVPGLGGKRR
jgi:cell division protein FtsL